MTTRLFGIRHHGAGSARHLFAALREYQPDCILLEGPPEADALLPLAAEADMQPPVALLAYRPDAPQQAVYYPFAAFSLRRAGGHSLAVLRFAVGAQPL